MGLYESGVGRYVREYETTPCIAAIHEIIRKRSPLPTLTQRSLVVLVVMAVILLSVRT